MIMSNERKIHIIIYIISSNLSFFFVNGLMHSLFPGPRSA